MTAVAVYGPVEARFGRSAGILAGFLFSGLAHEVAISLPVRAGYGLPLAYFALHGLLVLAEGRARGRSAAVGRALTACALVLPLPLLFHRAFLNALVAPLLP